MQESSGRRHYNIRICVHRRELRTHRISAQHQRSLQIEKLADLFDELKCLDGQLTRWRQDNSAGSLAGITSFQFLEERNQKAGRLTGTGLGHGNDVSAFEDQRDCLEQ